MPEEEGAGGLWVRAVRLLRGRAEPQSSYSLEGRRADRRPGEARLSRGACCRCFAPSSSPSYAPTRGSDGPSRSSPMCASSIAVPPSAARVGRWRRCGASSRGRMGARTRHSTSRRRRSSRPRRPFARSCAASRLDVSPPRDVAALTCAPEPPGHPRLENGVEPRSVAALAEALEETPDALPRNSVSEVVRPCLPDHGDEAVPRNRFLRAVDDAVEHPCRVRRGPAKDGLNQDVLVAAAVETLHTVHERAWRPGSLS
jgi:hypothetical protein